MLVTHKFRLIELVDWIVVLTPQGIALDLLRDAVIAQLQQRAAQQSSGAPAQGAEAPRSAGAASHRDARTGGPVTYAVQFHKTGEAVTS
ncbi:MAG: hypothetical protein MO853_10210 [Candidatus Protistobacter heckmanni]|nr:hypothetical protein [Candidatus Protistobacter heckmanni]